MRTVEQMEAHEQLHKTIDKKDALIKQLGEALKEATASHEIYTDRWAMAVAMYEAWKAGQP